ncbi:MAG: hypothetical protein ACSLE6_07345 [Mycobacterium sp.]
MRNLKRNAAITGAAAILAAFGVGGVVAAQASDSPAPVVQQTDGDGEVDDATEVEGAEEANDGPDQGPDANPNEPGHQDADESGETEGAEGAEEANDGPDQGPDTNPNEPGHQDADESGETE